MQNDSACVLLVIKNLSMFNRDILINKLQVTSYELISLRVAFIARVMSYELFLLHELRVTFYIQVTIYCLLHELRVTFIARVMSYCLLHELRVTVNCTSYELLFAYELRVSFYMRVTSYFLNMSYNKDKKMIKLFMIMRL